MFGKDHRDDEIAFLRKQNQELMDRLMAMTDVRAAALVTSQRRQAERDRTRSDPNAMPVINITGPGPDRTRFESDADMEAAFRGQQ